MNICLFIIVTGHVADTVIATTVSSRELYLCASTSISCWTIYKHSGGKGNTESSSGTSDLTFGFVVSKLVVGEAKPSLLEVLHSEAVSPLCSLYHESDGKTD